MGETARGPEADDAVEPAVDGDVGGDDAADDDATPDDDATLDTEADGDADREVGVGGSDTDTADPDGDAGAGGDTNAEDLAAEDAVATTADRVEDVSDLPVVVGEHTSDDPTPPVILPAGTRALADPEAEANDAAPTVRVPEVAAKATGGETTDDAGMDGDTDAEPDGDAETSAGKGFAPTVQRLRERTLRWWTRSGANGARRWGVTLVVAALVLVVGLLIADRWALVRARGEVLDALTELTDEMDGGEVEIDGFPFLSQVISGRIDRVDFEADRIALDGLELMDVTGRAEGVAIRAPREAARLDASATVPLALIQEQVAATSFDIPILGPRTLSADIEGNDLVIETEILTGTVHVIAEVAPTDDGRGIHIHLGRGTVAGVSTEISELPVVGSRIPVDHYVDLENLPPNVEVTEARVQSDGIRVTIEGRNVPLDAQVPADPESPSESPSGQVDERGSDGPVTGLGQDRGGSGDGEATDPGDDDPTTDDDAADDPPGSGDEGEESDPASVGDKSTGQSTRETDEDGTDSEGSGGDGPGVDLRR
ncbi:Putative peptidoglycan bound protein (LPXTG motif) Lmo1799 homolog [Actinomycetales bacterium JB111]|nr:Putative peptidoglycan bound protein (LPXTG motif) Lmo1799 homolog [Actinomycetales bacterium JB111]